jgi:hypothetical protein
VPVVRALAAYGCCYVATRSRRPRGGTALRGLINVRFAPKATEVLRCREPRYSITSSARRDRGRIDVKR